MRHALHQSAQKSTSTGFSEPDTNASNDLGVSCASTVSSRIGRSGQDLHDPLHPEQEPELHACPPVPAAGLERLPPMEGTPKNSCKSLPPHCGQRISDFLEMAVNVLNRWLHGLQLNS
jgi:hypothetical protein